jgi:RNA polymerase sigma-70 factor (ECF subfamily)
MSRPGHGASLAHVDVIDVSAPCSTLEPGEMDPRLEGYRRELTGYVARMLGSSFEAEDAVQETMVRAWRGFDHYEGRATLRSWLYRIATNVCCDVVRGRQRHAFPMGLALADAAESPLGGALPPGTMGQAITEGEIRATATDPAELTASRETIRLAFVVTLQHLPPRQRAVLILREVLRWQAVEVAELLGSTVASVNSALQRARSTLAASDLAAIDPSHPLDGAQRRLLARYVDAFQRCDVETLVSLLRQDATHRTTTVLPAPDLASPS